MSYHIPAYTCPTINRIKKAIQTSIANCKIDRIDSIDELKNIIETIEYELWGTPDELEEIRQANTELRDGLHFWKNKTRELEQEIQNLTEQLENQIGI